MALYHFDTCDGVGGAPPDRAGTELPDVASARREALRLAGTMIADRAISGDCLGRWHLGVTSHDGDSMIVMDALASSSAMAPAG